MQPACNSLLTLILVLSGSYSASISNWRLREREKKSREAKKFNGLVQGQILLIFSCPGQQHIEQKGFQINYYYYYCVQDTFVLLIGTWNAPVSPTFIWPGYFVWFYNIHGFIFGHIRLSRRRQRRRQRRRRQRPHAIIIPRWLITTTTTTTTNNTTSVEKRERRYETRSNSWASVWVLDTGCNSPSDRRTVLFFSVFPISIFAAAARSCLDCAIGVAS